MYFITKEQDLIGKKIVFTHMAQFADKLTIITEDKGIFVVEQLGEGDDKETIIHNQFGIKNYLNETTQKWIYRELNQKGIITDEEFEDYENEQKRIQIEKEIEWKRQQEERERKEYERLKQKYNQ